MRKIARWQAVVAVCGVLMGSIATRAGEGDTSPQDSLVVIDFSKLSPEPEFKGKRGIFRDRNDPPEVQFISEDVALEKVGGGKMMGFLRLAYRLGAQGTFNGYWIKPDAPRSDWAAFARDGALALRLKVTEKTPPVILLEIKTADVKGGSLTTFPVPVLLIDESTTQQMQSKGYADVFLPLGRIVTMQQRVDPNTLQFVEQAKAPNYKMVEEITLVNVHDNLPAEHRAGTLLLNSVRLVKGAPQP